MSFYPFARLPTELRSAIWELALSALQPREVELVCDTDDSDDNCEDDVKRRVTSTHTSINQIPSLLLVCQESCTVALQRYTFAFDAAWVDFETDTVVANVASREIILDHADITKVTRFKTWCGEDVPWNFLGYSLSQNMPSVRHLEFTVENMSSPRLEMIFSGFEWQIASENILFRSSDGEKVYNLDEMAKSWRAANVRSIMFACSFPGPR